MHQKELSLQVGDSLQLQRTPADRPQRHTVQVVGYMPGQSLIVTTPRVNGKVALVRPDQRYAVRVLQGSSVIGFVSSVSHAYNVPFPHMHLSYPQAMERIVVRDALRVDTQLRARVANTRRVGSEAQRAPVTIVDLSNSGARLASAESLGGEDEMLVLQFELEVCGALEGLNLIAQIRGTGDRQVEGDASRFWTGVRFRTLNRMQKLLLHAYVLERLLGAAHEA